MKSLLGHQYEMKLAQLKRFKITSLVKSGLNQALDERHGSDVLYLQTENIMVIVLLFIFNTNLLLQ